MLKPDYLLHISEGAEDISEALHNEIIKRIINRIMLRISRNDDYILTAYDKWNIETLQQAGYLLEDIQKEIAKATKLQEKEIAEAMEEAGVKALDYDDKIYQSVGLSPTPLTQSPELIRLMQRNYEATIHTWKNFTRTMADEAQRLFISQLDMAYTLVSTGALSYTQAVKEVLNNIVTNGVVVNYPSGHSDTIETATLRAVRTGVSQATGQITLARMKEMGACLAITSSHLGARPSHAVWQGKVFYVDWKRMDEIYPLAEIPMPKDIDTSLAKKYPDFIESTRIGKVDGLEGANCRHSHSVYYQDMDNPFEQYDSEENRKQYEKEQRQRTLERRIRKTKREVMGWKEAVDNETDDKAKFELDLQYQKKSSLLQKQNEAYMEYCKKNNLRPLSDRITIARWNRQQAAAARGAAKRYENAHGGNVEKSVSKAVAEEQKTTMIRLPERKPMSFSTIEDAEEYCMKFVDKNGFKAIGKKSVNFKGLDIEVVNDIVAELDRVFDGTDIKKFDSIEVFGKVNKKYWERHQSAPMATSNLGNLFLNKEILKNKKSVLSYNEEGKKAFDFVLSRIDTLQGAKRAMAERYKKAGHSLVSGDLRDMLLHETGHHLSFMREYNAYFGKVLKDTDWVSWSEKISGYAGHSADEYIAESWVAFNLGEDIQPEMRDIFERVIKNGTGKGN